MDTHLERCLERWTKTGLIDIALAERIRAFEAEQEKMRGMRWPVLLAISFGGVLLGAGVLLFVAAHWENLSPAERFCLVLLLITFFHVAGAVTAKRFSILSIALHAVGTICLGAGIFLSGQIFHLQEHWPSGVMLWALGAWVAWGLLRDWPQAMLVALLTPAWLGSEWIEATSRFAGYGKILAEGALLLAITYLTSILPQKITVVRKALGWVGGLALIPAVFALVNSAQLSSYNSYPLPLTYQLLGWTAALALPLMLAWWLRHAGFWINLVAVLWVMTLGAFSYPTFQAGHLPRGPIWHELGIYGICVLGSIGSIAWGIKEKRKERINLGVAGFALTVLVFYFSSVMDKLGRSISLIGVGVLFVVMGWLLEKMRRRLLSALGKVNHETMD